MEETKEPMVPARGLSRRSFIKGAAATAALGTLAGCAPQTVGGDEEDAPLADTSVEIPETQHFAGICRCGCAGHCFLDVHVRDGQVVRTTAGEMADNRYNRVCSKGLSHVARIYSSKRLQYPMRRTGERGSGEFERITWDEAIAEICAKYQEYAEKDGPASNVLHVGSGNFGSVALKSIEQLKAVLGMSSSNMSADLETSFAMGNTLGYGGFGTQNEQADWPNAKVFVCWMSDPCNSTPQSMHFILDAKEAGAKYVVIDPVFNANAGKADWFLGVNPSTDGALAFGALNYLLEQGWQDEEFIRARTEAPLFVKADGALLRMSDLGVEPTTSDQIDPMTGQPAVIDPLVVWDEAADAPAAVGEAGKPSLTSRETVNDIPVTLVYDLIKQRIAEYPVSRAAELSGIAEDDIRELARMYAQDGPVTTYCMFGTDRYINGHFNYWPVFVLAAFTGNMAKSGAGVGWTYSQGSGFVNPLCGAGVVDAEGNPAQGVSGIDLPLLSMEEVLESGTYADQSCPVHSLTIFMRNLMATGGDHESLVRWMKALDFVVVADMDMTETALYADILLPVCHWFEYEDFVGGGGSTPLFMIQEKCTEPMYESKCDYDICKLIAEGMGYGQFFTETASEYLDKLLTSDALAALGVTPESLRASKTAREFTVDNFVSFEQGFGTTTGLFKLYNDAPMPWYAPAEFDATKEIMPYWEPARYADVNSAERTSGEYPYHIFSQHMRVRTHSQWWNVGYTLELDGEPTVQINPADAVSEGIAEGDYVKLASKSGDVTLKAVINPGVPEKMLVSGRSFNSFEFKDGHFGALSHSEMGQATPDTAVNDVVVTLEKTEA